MKIAFYLFLFLSIYAIIAEYRDQRKKYFADLKLEKSDSKFKIIRKLQKLLFSTKVEWRKNLISSMIALLFIKYFLEISLSNRDIVVIVFSIFFSFYLFSSIDKSDKDIHQLLLALKKTN